MHDQARRMRRRNHAGITDHLAIADRDHAIAIAIVSHAVLVGIEDARA